MVFMSMTYHNKIKIFPRNASIFHHIKKPATQTKLPRIYQERFLVQYDIIPSGTKVPSASVGIFGRETQDLMS